jgi:hypothetical protein
MDLSLDAWWMVSEEAPFYGQTLLEKGCIKNRVTFSVAPTPAHIKATISPLSTLFENLSIALLYFGLVGAVLRSVIRKQEGRSTKRNRCPS